MARSFTCAAEIRALLDLKRTFDDVWSGRALQEDFVERMCGLVHLRPIA
jgi:hypothetical protein